MDKQSFVNAAEGTCHVVPIHSELPLDCELEAFAPPSAGCTRVIVATEAAESSVTLPDVDFVIDLGGRKQVAHDAERDVSTLSRVLISKAAASQQPHPSRHRRRRPKLRRRLLPAHAKSSACR